MQGRKLGLKIINTLEEIGRALGCYKIILDCSKENIRESSYRDEGVVLIIRLSAFYEKCGRVKLFSPSATYESSRLNDAGSSIKNIRWSGTCEIPYWCNRQLLLSSEALVCSPKRVKEDTVTLYGRT